MRVYHGTINHSANNILNNGINLSKSKLSLDFGKGFYTTTDIEFAESTAINKTKKTNMYKGDNYCIPCVLEFEYNNSDSDSLNILSFNEVSLDWAQFIINNRNGIEYTSSVQSDFHNLYLQYDIVVGAIADNRITSISQELQCLKEKIGIMEFLNIHYPYNTTQISFHTPASLACLSLIDCGIIQ